MRKLKIGLAIVVSLLLVIVAVYYFNVQLDAPSINSDEGVVEVAKRGANYYQTAGGDWLKLNKYGLWEMSLSGKPYKRGVAFGALAESSGLMAKKEAAFVGEIENRVPSKGYLNFLKYLVGWFNRDLDEYVPEEYLLEIYGSSRYMPDAYDYVAPKFHRALSYHAAHDIGHALQNMNLVGCTSFATWDNQSVNNNLLIGRNFDFYFGQEFAKDKIIAFYKPEEGYQFMSVTWACFSGVVSGMNEMGLTVTLNSAKSEIPTKGKTPVSLIAREILQYAKSIEEAFEIAKKYESFVAETFLIGSREDGKVGLIEKSPEHTGLYLSDENEMVITNHFQSDDLKDDPLNKEYEAEEVSGYRFKRVEQLIDSISPLAPEDFVAILRDKKGLGGANIGLSNEKAINQLIAHHSVVFSPSDMMVWVSSPPYVLGEYVAYDLKEIFSKEQREFTYSDSLTMPQDPFLTTDKYKSYEQFVELKERIISFLFTGKGEKLSDFEVNEFVSSNPNSFLTYYYLGDYMLEIEAYDRAVKFLKKGLTLEIAKVSERKHMEESLDKALSELSND